MKDGRELDVLVAEKMMGWKDVWQPFQPSTEISDAFLVVEKLRRQMWMLFGLSHSCIDENNIPQDYRCVFLHVVTGKSSEVVAETAPLAICLASLKTVGVDAG